MTVSYNLALTVLLPYHTNSQTQARIPSFLKYISLILSGRDYPWPLGPRAWAYPMMQPSMVKRVNNIYILNLDK